MNKNLKDRQYYEDLYDKHTVEHCRMLRDISLKMIKKEMKKNPQLTSDSDKLRSHDMAYNFQLYFETGERYLNKEKTIQEWMDRDKREDELYNSSHPPLVRCRKCNKVMDMILKDLERNFYTEETKVLFYYRCLDCKEKRGIYDTGEEYAFKESLCPKCNHKLDIKVTKKKTKYVHNDTCPKCSYTDTWEFDLSKKKDKKPIDPDFEKDKARYCLSPEYGQEYQSFKIRLESLRPMFDEMNEKKVNKELYEKLSNIKRMTVVELSDLLGKELAKEQYIGLSLTNPEVSKDLIVSFTIQDAKSGREQYDSEHDLKKLINKILDNTNWKLMSEGIYYKLGLLSGRLRGKDDDKDLLDDLKRKLGVDKQDLEDGQVYGKDGEVITL